MRGFKIIAFSLLWHNALSICSLCAVAGQDDLGVDGLLHPNEFIDENGNTCAQLMIALFQIEKDDPRCHKWYDSSHDRCCTDPKLPPLVQKPPPPPPQFTIDGPYNRCDLCRGGGYPTVSTMVINLLYVGPGTCPQYYEWGQRGWIQDHLCSALQHYAWDSCGCESVVS